MIQIPTTKQEPFWKTIELGDGGNFQIQLRKPTFSEVLTDSERMENYAERRVKTLVLGWKDVKDEHGKDVAFSYDGLAAICGAFPSAGMKVYSEVQNAYHGISEEQVKNSETLSAQGSTQSAQNSESGGSSKEPAASAKPKA